MGSALLGSLQLLCCLTEGPFGYSHWPTFMLPKVPGRTFFPICQISLLLQRPISLTPFVRNQQTRETWARPGPPHVSPRLLLFFFRTRPQFLHPFGRARWRWHPWSLPRLRRTAPGLWQFLEASRNGSDVLDGELVEGVLQHGVRLQEVFPEEKRRRHSADQPHCCTHAGLKDAALQGGTFHMGNLTTLPPTILSNTRHWFLWNNYLSRGVVNWISFQQPCYFEHIVGEVVVKSPLCMYIYIYIYKYTYIHAYIYIYICI